MNVTKTEKSLHPYDEETLWIALAIMALCSMLSWGCGASALDNATRTLGAARTAQTATVQIIERGLTNALDSECLDEPFEEREQCARRVAADYRTAERALDASAETLDSAALALLVWARRAGIDDDDPPFEVCEAIARVVRLVGVWSVLADSEILLGDPLWTCGGADK